jgi:xanthine dehydrogenase YagS FAD-binding subunit
MRPFEFHVASSTDQAMALLSSHAGARLLAGGTTLVDLMKHEVETPAHVIDINRLDLRRVDELADGGLSIGAMVRNSDLARHPLVVARYPMLSQALLAGASPQLRNMATTAGNLLQRTRCYYFRDVASPCNKREPSSGCSALHGFNRIHAVLGGSERCIATHPSDMAVPLVALDAIVHVRDQNRERVIPIREFNLQPGDEPWRENTLMPEELIVSVELPPVPFARRSVYIKVRDRRSYAFALASAAVALDLDGPIIRDARIAIGGVATIPWRVPAAEAALRGKRVGGEAFANAAELAVHGAVPRKHNAFKIELAMRTVMRALARAAERP